MSMDAVSEAPVEESRGATRVLAMSLFARLINFSLTPLSFVRPSFYNELNLDFARLKELSQYEEFMIPLNQVLFKRLDLHRMKIPAHFLGRLETDVALRLCVLVVSAQRKEFYEVVSFFSAALLHKQLLQLVLKKERQRAVEVLGAEAFQLAVREAPVLYPALAGVCPESLYRLLCERIPSESGQAGRSALLDIGYLGLMEFVHQSEPALLELLSYRIPEDLIEKSTLLEMSEKARGSLVKLLKRRMATWAAFMS